MTSREKWKEILPVLQAFVEGKQVQCKGYDHRWKDTDTMYSLLHNQYRIKPEHVTNGVWTVKFTERVHGSVNGPTAEGEWMWEGNSDDTPPWPIRNEITILKDTEKFTSKET